MHLRYKGLILVFIFVTSFFGILLSNWLTERQPTLAEVPPILQPAPTQPIGYYDYFGQLFSPQEAANLVSQKGLEPSDPISYQRIGAVQITQELINKGEDIFFNRKIGDSFGLQRVLGFGVGITRVLPELTVAIAKLHGRSTKNLQIKLLRDISLGSRTFPKGTVVNTGLQVERGKLVPVGLKPLSGDITCAICHAKVSGEGKRLTGVPNGELAIPLLIAISPNTAAGFARLNLNPLDPQYQGNGKTIINSRGNLVKLPDPQKFERAFDDAVLDVPFGNFESSPDGIDNTTQIPSVFTFKSNPYLADGQFAVGPFAGLSVINVTRKSPPSMYS